jgi:hypothetical protein
MLNLTPDQQAIFDRVVGIVTQNDELRRQFKAANEALDKNPNGNELEYINDSDEPDAVNFRAASDAIRAEVRRVSPSLKKDDSWLFSKISTAICHAFLDR